MNLFDYYKNGWSEFGNFSGIMSRKAYWNYFLAELIVAFCVGFTDGFFFFDGTLTTIYGLAILIPQLSASVRRAHDSGRSGGWVIIPVVRFFIMLAEGGKKNKYGKKPKF